MQNTLSWKFQIGMVILAAVFWLLGCIPFVNIVTNALYWIIWGGIFAFKYRKLISHIASLGTQVSIIYLKIILISVIALALGEIPFVSIFPWDIVSNIWINGLIKKALAKAEGIKKSAEELQKSWTRKKMQAEQAEEEDEDMRIQPYKASQELKRAA